MARSYARISVDIWTHDQDFVALDPLDKLVWIFLLSQSKLSLAGCIDTRLDRWAPRIGVTLDQLQQSLDRLEDRGYVVVDDQTGELVIRTFTRHDVSRSPKVLAGMWSAWRAIESPMLRDIVLRNMPDFAWEHDQVKPLAVRPQLVDEYAIDTPSDRQSIPYGDGIPCGIDTPHPQPQPQPLPATIIRDAIALIADYRLTLAVGRGVRIDDEQAYRATIIRNLHADDGAAIAALASADPTLTAEQLRDRWLEPEPLTSYDDLVGPA